MTSPLEEYIANNNANITTNADDIAIAKLVSAKQKLSPRRSGHTWGKFYQARQILSINVKTPIEFTQKMCALNFSPAPSCPL